ncbi:MAG: DNA adenine methylase [Clostridia bacterium]
MTKSIISWVGGKAKLMWIINLFSPTKFKRSIDVFGGSGTVTLNLDCPKSNLKVYNDFNRDLVNLMRCARERPMELIREIGFLSLNSRDDFEICKKFLQKDEFFDENLQKQLDLTEIYFDTPQADELKAIFIAQSQDTDIKRASAYYKLLRLSFNSNADTFGGKRCNLYTFFKDIWSFSHAFRYVTIENKDFEALIKQYDREDAFIYCDPPYYNAEDFYAVGFAKENHVRLRDTLENIDGFAMISYNNCPEILALYEKFYIYLTTRPHSMSKKEGELYEELIITNYDPKQHINHKNGQMSLFASIISSKKEQQYEIIHEPTEPLRK